LGVEINGLAEVQEELDDLQDNYGETTTRYVGSNVEYAPVLEYGSAPHTITGNPYLYFENQQGQLIRKRSVNHPGTQPYPHWRPAKASAGRDPVGYIREHLGVGSEGIESTSQLVVLLSFALERDVKSRITDLGLVDTGNYRASVATAPAPGDLPDVDED